MGSQNQGYADATGLSRGQGQGYACPQGESGTFALHHDKGSVGGE